MSIIYLPLLSLGKLWDVDWTDVSGSENSTHVKTGEHIFSDNYFLKPEEFKSNAVDNVTKRPRI